MRRDVVEAAAYLVHFKRQNTFPPLEGLIRAFVAKDTILRIALDKHAADREQVFS